MSPAPVLLIMLCTPIQSMSLCVDGALLIIPPSNEDSVWELN